MGNGVIAFMLAIGVSAWIYAKLMRTTGGNTKNAVTGAAISGVLLFILALIVLSLIPG